MRLRMYLILLFLLLTGLSFGQPKYEYSIKSKKAISYFENARSYYERNRDAEAKELLLKALKVEDEFLEAHMLLADIYHDARYYQKAINENEKSIALNPDFFPNTYYNIAKSELKLGRYADAKTHLEKFLTYENIRKIPRGRGEKLLQNATFGAEAVKNPVPFNPVNLGKNVNSEDEEYWPAMAADEQTLIITRRELQRVDPNSSLKQLREDFYISEKVDGKWTKARNLGKPINTKKNEGALCLSPDGQYVFFIACHRKDGKGSCDIYLAKRSGKLWADPVNLDFPVNSPRWESAPSFSSDGRTLYFTSDRSGGKGKKDIWMTTLKDDGNWTKPVGLNFNTRGNEMSPFIHPDNQTLYFASDYYPGMGGLDIFYVHRKPNGEWGEPINLGYPINTLADENSLFVNSSGELAFFASDREDGIGKLDIYSFDLYKEARPQKVTYAKGKVYDADTKKELKAKFELIDLETNKVAVQSFSDSRTGEFLVCLPVNRDYALNVSKEGYLFYSENFSIKDMGEKAEPFFMDVPMQPIKEGRAVVLKNVFFETAKYDLKPESRAELDKLIGFLQANPSMKIELGGYTDNVGSNTDNQLLSKNRAKAVYDYLLDHDIVKERLTYKGYGESKPIEPNDTDEGRARNRRTEFKVIEK